MVRPIVVFPGWSASAHGTLGAPVWMLSANELSTHISQELESTSTLAMAYTVVDMSSHCIKSER
jgi:hypothetical protein